MKDPKDSNWHGQGEGVWRMNFSIVQRRINAKARSDFLSEQKTEELHFIWSKIFRSSFRI